ncbi:MAG: hypothetical protein V1784_07175 [bacterium]
MDIKKHLAIGFEITFILSVALLLILIASVSAQPYTAPRGRYGQVAVTAAAAIQIPMLLTARQGVLVQNLGPNAIFCGFDNAVTTANGISVAANGGTYSTSAGWDGTNLTVWCRTTVLQVAPADTRWSEVK